MTARDPFAALAAAHLRHDRAIAAREQAEPGSDAYRLAVLEVGHSWALVQRRRREIQRRAEPGEGKGSTTAVIAALLTAGSALLAPLAEAMGQMV